MIQEPRQLQKARRPSQVFRTVVRVPASRPRAADLAVIILFLVGIALPGAGLILGLDAKFELIENHPPAPRPKITMDRATWAEFPRKFEAYFDDHFGFRKRLIYSLAIVKVLGLGVSSSNNVIVGKEGWLFYSGDRSLDYYRSTRPFTPADLEWWRHSLQKRHDWLASRGIRYLFVVMPNKETIYPEFMPNSYNRVSPQSRLDQLVNYLKSHSTMTILDVREALRQAKGTERLYDRTDSHWNERGANLAYAQVVEALSGWFPEMKPLPPADFRDYAHLKPGGDLAGMLGLRDRTKEEFLGRQLRTSHTRRTQAGLTPHNDVPEFMATYALERDDTGLPRAVMFHDSFSDWFVPALSEHFRRLVYVWSYNFDRELLERERPDVVIQEMVERSLMGPVPKEPF